MSLEKGQNAIITGQDLRIRGCNRKIPPIKRIKLRSFGPLFIAVERHMLNRERQIHPCDLSYAISCHPPVPNLLIEESFHVERFFVFKHEVDGSAQFVGEYTQRFSLVVLVG